MGRVIAGASVSLDGFSAGTDSGPEHPLGIRGERLHAWMGEGSGTGLMNNIGAVIIGNTMFRCGEGPWGDENPYGKPVFVLTTTARDDVYRRGEIAFRFVTDGLDAAMHRAQDMAGDEDVLIGGGANVLQQYLRRGDIGVLELNVIPTFLGAGTRLLDAIPHTLNAELASVIEGTNVTHLQYLLSKTV